MTQATVLRKLPIDWEALELVLDPPTEWEKHYDLLDTETGQFIFVHEEVMRKVRNGQPEQLLAPWQQEDIPLAERVLAGEPGRYVDVPVLDTAQRWRTRLDFARKADLDEEARLRLRDALDGPGVFRRFEKAVGGIHRGRKLWSDFERRWNLQLLQDWLRSLGIEADPPSWSRVVR